MRDERLSGGTMINPSWAKAHLPGYRRDRLGLALLLALGLLLAFLGPALAADGALDPSFITGPGPYAGVQTIPEIRGQVGYPKNTDGSAGLYDGYSLLFGTFWGLNVGGNPAPPTNCIARLKPDGTVDGAFNLYNPQTSINQINGEIRAVYIYPHDDPNYQDMILIGGRFNAFSGSTAYANFARLKADGSLDTSFPQAFTSWDGSVNSFGVQGSGATAKILVGGYNLAVGQEGPNRATYQLIRLNFDGSLDPNYIPWGAPGGYIIGVKVYPADDTTGNANCARLWCLYPKPGGLGTYYVLLLDTDFTTIKASIGSETVNGPIYNMAKENISGNWVICGLFNQAYDSVSKSWVTKNRVARLKSDLTLDTTYDVGAGPNGAVLQINPMKANPPSYDDRMVLAGSFTAWNGAPRGCIVRLTTTGAEDSTTFNTGSGTVPGSGADDRIQRLNWKPDGTGGWIYGYFRSYDGQARGGIAGVDGNGNLTGSYANVTAQAGWPGVVYSLATQSDGKIIIGGDFNGVGGKYRGGLARLNPNGSLDPSFKSHLDGRVMSVAVQSDGKILVGGPFGECQGFSCTSLARINPDGSLDTTFKPMLVGGDNSLNQVNHVVPQSDGQIMIAGDIYNNTCDASVARLNSDGSLDSAFFSNVSSIPNPIPGPNGSGAAGWRWRVVSTSWPAVMIPPPL